MGLFPKDDGNHDDSGEGGYKRLRDIHHHDQPPQSPPPGKLRELYNRYANKPSTLLLTTVLLGTTALMTPALNSIIGAGAILAGSFWLLDKSSKLILNHANALGQKTSKLTPLALGLGISALTAIPEVGIALISMARNTTEIGIGTLVGSNIAHSTLVLGAIAAISPILKNRGLGWKFNALAMTGITGVLGAQIATNTFTPASGLGLIGLSALYLYGLRKTLKHDAEKMHRPIENLIHHHADGSSCGHDHGHDHHHENPAMPLPRWKNIAYAAGGVAGLVAASDLAIHAVSAGAESSGFSSAALSSVAVSLGAVLPELVVSIEAARSKNTELAVGNVLGCNISNVLMVGTALSFAGAQVSASMAPTSPLGMFNLAALGASTALMAGMLLAQKGAVKRSQGIGALALYGAFALSTPAIDKIPENKAILQPPAISVPR